MRSSGSEADLIRIHVYQGVDGWRWTAIGSNGPKLAHGGQGYGDMRDLVRDLHLVTGAGGIVSTREPDVVHDCQHHRNDAYGDCRVWEVQR